MTVYDKLKKQKKSAHEDTNNELKKLNTVASEAKNTAKIAGEVRTIIGNIEAQFDMATQLTGKDKQFLFIAVALQCIRQYVLGSITQRKDHNESDKGAHNIQDMIFGNDRTNESNAMYQKKLKEYREDGARYRATREEILHSYSVPYDVTNNTKKYGVGGVDNTGNYMGISGTNHRVKTLGHDPLFGWVFGTANIMTNTMTNNMLQTFHVKNSAVVSNGGLDKTIKMLDHFKDRSHECPADLIICLAKQGLHIMSDTYSKEGIAIPGTVLLNSDYAKQLSDYGIDLGNVIKVGAQASFSLLINRMIAMLHGMQFDSSLDMDWNLYSVRTRKILMYSNIIASSSNVIAVACGTAIGGVTGNSALVKEAANYLDIGGLVVTINQIVSDKKFIYEVKKEFIKNQWYDLVMGIDT